MELLRHYTSIWRQWIAVPANWLTGVLLLLGALVAWQNLAFYLRNDFNVVLTLLVAPFVLYIRQPGVFSLKYGWVSLTFLALYPWLQIQLLFFLGFTFFVLFIIESRIGRMNHLPVFVVLLLSPICYFLFETLGFHLRLMLTELAASLLQPVMAVTAQGNMLQVHGEAFSVDPACMGLNMTITSYLITLGLIAFREKKGRRQLPLLAVIGLLVATTGCILVSNLFRILGVVVLRAAPETFSHEVIGLLALVVYVVLPMYGLSRWAITRWGRMEVARPLQKPGPWSVLMAVVAVASLGWLNLHRDDFRQRTTDPMEDQITLNGFEKSVVGYGVVKLENEAALIYIKPPVPFYGSDHYPGICWVGGGYEFRNIRQQEIAGCAVMMAEMHREDEVLHTAWWYDNGTHRTTSQLDWRWRTILGEQPFRLINVSSTEPQVLNAQIAALLTLESFPCGTSVSGPERVDTPVGENSQAPSGPLFFYPFPKLSLHVLDAS